MTISIDIGGNKVALSLRRSARARRMALRALADGIELVLPEYGSERAALDFARSRGDWILDRLARASPRVRFADGALVPYLGVEHRIVQAAARRGVVERDVACSSIAVPGAPEHLPRRLTDWFKGQARTVLTPLALEKANAISKRVIRISVRDMTSRWGSCSRAGALSFSWRIVMAPEGAIDWLVAHEVAHLAHMNHGPRFWETARALTSGDFEHWRAWLRGEGEALMRYGA